METRLKERLTGAAILVALIVALVPEMFRGQSAEVAAKPGSSGEGPPLRSYTIDLSNSPSRTAPLQSTPPAPTPAAATEARTESKTAAAPAPHPTPLQPSAPSSAAAQSASAATNVTTVAAKPSSPASAAHTGGGWSVQLGLFASRDNADRMAHSAQSKGFNASVSERDVKGLYHVRMLGMADRAAAQTLQQRLHDQGFAAAVVPPAAGSAKAQP